MSADELILQDYTPIINSINFYGQLIDVLRLDLMHPQYGGNKYFKLKYNLKKAKSLNLNTILTFGGAHSNHIYSCAAVCKELGFNSIAVIRGEESLITQSPTLQFALKCGMKLHFISREKYKGKTDESFIEELKQVFGEFYLVPEGGNNYDGVKGCTQILTEELKGYDYVFCACGTATTFSGIKISAKHQQKIIGVSVLKGKNELINDANEWFEVFNSEKINPLESGIINQSTIISDYHFGGYATYNKQLVDFKKEFENKHSIGLDYIYTSKLFYSVFDLINNGRINPNSKILIIHSGGQQGNKGFETRYNI